MLSPITVSGVYSNQMNMNNTYSIDVQLGATSPQNN